MKKVLGFVLVMLCAVSATAYAGPAEGTYFSSGNTNTTPDPAAYGQVVRPIDGFLKACEDQAANVCLIEYRYPRVKVTGNTRVKASSGYVQSITIAPNDSAPTAGTIVVYDNTAASGKELMRFEVTTTYFLPFTIPVHSAVSNGIYVSFTTTADVNVWVNYR